MSETENNSNKIKHLDYIQDTISRMSTASFAIKTATVTVASGVFALSMKPEFINVYSLLYFTPIFSFWYLDAYYLRQERLFRALYDKVRLSNKSTNFSMNTNKKDVPGILFTAIYPPLSILYLMILIVFCLYFFPNIMSKKFH